MVGACGVIAIDTSAAGLTVRVTVADTPFKVMRIVVVPTPLLVARPCLPAELLIVATAAVRLKSSGRRRSQSASLPSE